jgi:hypothetical protein
LSHLFLSSITAYSKLSSKKQLVAFTQRELVFNVAWNIWREIAEIGMFLLHFFSLVILRGFHSLL